MYGRINNNIIIITLRSGIDHYKSVHCAAPNETASSVAHVYLTRSPPGSQWTASVAAAAAAVGCCGGGEKGFCRH